MNKQEAIEKIKKDNSLTGGLVEKSLAIYCIEQIHEPQKVVVPKFVAEWIKPYRHSHTLLRVLNAVENKLVTPSAVNDWILDNQYDFIKAWIDGYDVEQEKLYTVEIPNPNLNAHVVLQKTADGLVLATVGNAGWAEWESSKLTESEIKQDFEWAFQFSKPVEE